MNFKINWKKFKLNHEPETDFVTSQWQTVAGVSKWYCLYRISAFLYFSISLVFILKNYFEIIHYRFFFIKLSNWQYLLTTYTAGWHMMSCMVAASKLYKGGHLRVSTWMYQIQWFLENASYPTSMLVCVLYWAVVYPNSQGEELDLDNLNLHAVPVLYAVLEMVISRAPRRPHHAVHSMAFNTVYLIFSCIYYFCGGLNMHGGTSLYSFLDWSRPAWIAPVALAVALVLAVFQILLCLLALVRRSLHARCTDDGGTAAEYQLDETAAQLDHPSVVIDGAIGCTTAARAGIDNRGLQSDE